MNLPRAFFLLTKRWCISLLHRMKLFAQNVILFKRNFTNCISDQVKSFCPICSFNLRQHRDQIFCMINRKQYNRSPMKFRFYPNETVFTYSTQRTLFRYTRYN